MADNIYIDERGYKVAEEVAYKLGQARAEVKGLIRTTSKLGHILKQIDPNNEYLKKKKIDEIYFDTSLEIPSPFK